MDQSVRDGIVSNANRLRARRIRSGKSECLKLNGIAAEQKKPVRLVCRGLCLRTVRLGCYGCRFDGNIGPSEYFFSF